jgi:hypothetical protein
MMPVPKLELVFNFLVSSNYVYQDIYTLLRISKTYRKLTLKKATKLKINLKYFNTDRGEIVLNSKSLKTETIEADNAILSKQLSSDRHFNSDILLQSLQFLYTFANFNSLNSLEVSGLEHIKSLDFLCYLKNINANILNIKELSKDLFLYYI